MKKLSKVQLIVFIISMLFLVFSMGFVIYKNFGIESKKATNHNIKNMTNEYIETNYEINLYDEKVGDNVKLNFIATYIGNDEIVKEPLINMDVDCYYVYKDANDIYTDMKKANINIIYKDGKYKGESNIDFGRSNIESYNCAYNIIKTTGQYK